MARPETIRPIDRRPQRMQVAALCTMRRHGRQDVLLVTSRGTGRWILPKGWPIDGLDASGAAAQEAWEEAGVMPAAVDCHAIGSFEYEKVLDGGLAVPVKALVFHVEVHSLSDDFPEADQRRRTWVSPSEAAQLVDEPGLQDLLRSL